MQLFTIHYDPRKSDEKYQRTRRLWQETVAQAADEHQRTLAKKHPDQQINKSHFTVIDENATLTKIETDPPCWTKHELGPWYQVLWGVDEQSGEYQRESYYCCDSLFRVIETHLTRVDDLRTENGKGVERCQVTTPSGKTMTITATYCVEPYSTDPVFTLRIES